LLDIDAVHSGLLGRRERPAQVPPVRGLRVVVTGGRGYIGRRVCALLAAYGADPEHFDAPLDVLDRDDLAAWAARDAWCVHLAAHKHAPAGEQHPDLVADLNVRGTANVVDAFHGRVVLASTCKAADPMTVYGASKLIAERIVLNGGGNVVRLVNVLGSSGSVLQIWRNLPASAPLPVTDNLRMWMTAREATHLLASALAYPSGRYVPDVPPAEPVAALAQRAYPGRSLEYVPFRRGDRERERLLGEYEVAERYAPGVFRVVAPTDHAVAGAAFAPALMTA
jgi:UDP-N-acetylglucosamine 4,6-dehydratase